MPEGTDDADGDTEDSGNGQKKESAGEIDVWWTVTDSICTSKWTDVSEENFTERTSPPSR